MTACLPRYRSRMPVLILLTLMATWQFGRNDAIAYASPATHKKRYRKEHPGSIDQRIHDDMLGIDIRPDFRLACAGGGARLKVVYRRQQADLAAHDCSWTCRTR